MFLVIFFGHQHKAAGVKTKQNVIIFIIIIIIIMTDIDRQTDRRTKFPERNSPTVSTPNTIPGASWVADPAEPFTLPVMGYRAKFRIQTVWSYRPVQIFPSGPPSPRIVVTCHHRCKKTFLRFLSRARFLTFFNVFFIFPTFFYF